MKRNGGNIAHIDGAILIFKQIFQALLGVQFLLLRAVSSQSIPSILPAETVLSSSNGIDNIVKRDGCSIHFKQV